MSKSSIKTKTVLTMTDMTESTELQAFKRQKDVIKLLLKFLCVFLLFYLETNSKSSKIYPIATMKYTWCTYLSPPLSGINHYNLQKNLRLHSYPVSSNVEITCHYNLSLPTLIPINVKKKGRYFYSFQEMLGYLYKRTRVEVIKTPSMSHVGGQGWADLDSRSVSIKITLQPIR